MGGKGWIHCTVEDLISKEKAKEKGQVTVPVSNR